MNGLPSSAVHFRSDFTVPTVDFKLSPYCFGFKAVFVLNLFPISVVNFSLKLQHLESWKQGKHHGAWFISCGFPNMLLAKQGTSTPLYVDCAILLHNIHPYFSLIYPSLFLSLSPWSWMAVSTSTQSGHKRSCPWLRQRTYSLTPHSS